MNIKAKAIVLAVAFCSLGGPQLIGAHQREPLTLEQRRLQTKSLLSIGNAISQFFMSQGDISDFGGLLAKIATEGITSFLHPRQTVPKSIFRVALAAILMLAEKYADAQITAAPGAIVSFTGKLYYIFSPLASAKQLPLLLGTSALISSVATSIVGGYQWAADNIDRYSRYKPITAESAAQDNAWGKFLLDATAKNDEFDAQYAIECNCALDGEYRSNYAAQVAMMNERCSIKDFHITFFGKTPYVGWSREYLENRTKFLDHIGSDPFTPLAYTAALGNCQLVSLLLNKGAALDYQTTNSRRTALHEAAYFGQAATVRLLLRAGADPERTDSKGHTALTLAASLHHADVIKMLLQHGAKIPVFEQIAQLGLSKQARILIKEQAHLAQQRSATIEKELMQQNPNLSADVARLIRSFATTIEPTPTTTERVTRLKSAPKYPTEDTQTQQSDPDYFAAQEPDSATDLTTTLMVDLVSWPLV